MMIRKVGLIVKNEKNINEKVKEDGELDELSIEDLKSQLEEKTKQSDEYYNMLQRTAAEFDNYKKRTAKERGSLYSQAVCDVVSAFLPIMDNIERAINVCDSEAEAKSIKEGIELINRSANEILKDLGVEAIKCVGGEFDPELHEAVMHVEDENYDQNTVIEEFQKGYKNNDKVIRHSVVKVAN